MALLDRGVVSGCHIEGCPGRHLALGLCRKHYRRWLKWRDPYYRDYLGPLGGPDDPRHGTPNGYNNLKCRCDRCTNAWRLRFAEYRDTYPYVAERARKREERQRRERGVRPRTELLASYPAHQPEIVETALELRKQGKSTRKIAAELTANGTKVSHQWVWKQIQKQEAA